MRFGLFAYHCCALLGRMAGRLLWGVRLEGAEHLPTEGGVLLAMSHESVLDPVIVGSYLAPRQVRFLGRNTLFGKNGRTSLFGRALLLVGAVPIEREGGGARDVLRLSRNLLEAGEMVLIFPEGTRSPDGKVRRFRRGVGMIARSAGCAVLPISIEGSHRLWKKGARLPRLRGGPVRLRLGAPQTYDKTTSAEDIAADLRQRVLALRDDPAGDGAGVSEAAGDGIPRGDAAGTEQ